MKVADLIELLQGANPDAEVRLATQPHWPLASTVHGVWDSTGEPCSEHDVFACDECEPQDILWISEGGQVSESPYAPRNAWDMAEVTA